MEIIREAMEIQHITTDLKKQRKKIGFVATMGYLHEGHIALMDAASRENDIVIASIFVNPLQFGPSEDYETYPRDEERDIKKAEEAGVDYLFIPTVSEMYPNKPIIEMKITSRVDVLCGASRPGHFDGVLTVLTKLFHLTQPDLVYFGMKDAQQVAVVDALVKEHNFPVQLVGVPTVREEDGLALSSRNVRLSEKERSEAVWLYRALLTGKDTILNGEMVPSKVVEEVRGIIQRETTGTIDYVDLLSYPELLPIEQIEGKIILAVAVQFQKARLIDNLIIDVNEGEVS